LILGAFFIACSKEIPVIYQTDPDDLPNTAPLVTVIYDPDALGDNSYNDLIFTGVEQAAKDFGLRTLQLSPVDMNEAEAYLEAWRNCREVRVHS